MFSSEKEISELSYLQEFTFLRIQAVKNLLIMFKNGNDSFKNNRRSTIIYSFNNCNTCFAISNSSFVGITKILTLEDEVLISRMSLDFTSFL